MYAPIVKLIEKSRTITNTPADKAFTKIRRLIILAISGVIPIAYYWPSSEEEKREKLNQLLESKLMRENINDGMFMFILNRTEQADYQAIKARRERAAREAIEAQTEYKIPPPPSSCKTDKT